MNRRSFIKTLAAACASLASPSSPLIGAEGIFPASSAAPTALSMSFHDGLLRVAEKLTATLDVKGAKGAIKQLTPLLRLEFMEQAGIIGSDDFLPEDHLRGLTRYVERAEQHFSSVLNRTDAVHRKELCSKLGEELRKSLPELTAENFPEVWKKILDGELEDVREAIELPTEEMSKKGQKRYYYGEQWELILRGNDCY